MCILNGWRLICYRARLNSLDVLDAPRNASFAAGPELVVRWDVFCSFGLAWC